MINMFLSMLMSSCLVLLVDSVQYAPEVEIDGGRIRGLLANLTTGHVVRKYIGIRFAKADRFKAPTNDDSKWSDVRDMITFGNECPQLSGLSGQNPELHEDCLNLNVFVPNTVSESSSLPVMVWVHGGGYVSGSNRMYDGSFISCLGNVIVVVINYRLTVFGFLATGENDLQGNYGMLDQVQGLKWVKRNIAGFGGDPNKVTIFGESAGGSSVSLLMLSPLTKGLFQNVIMQSGAATAKWAAVTLEEMKEVTRSFGKRIGCTDLDDIADCLKTKSLNDIINSTTGDISFVPTIDGHFLPDAPSLLLQRGDFQRCNMMVGVTNDEGTVMTNAVIGLASGIDVKNGVQREFFEKTVKTGDLKTVIDQRPPLPSAMIYRYTDWKNVSDPYRNRRMYIDMMSDAMFVAPAILSANAFVNHSLPTYFYQFQHRADSGFFGLSIPSWVRAYHGADLLYVFGFPLLNVNASLHKTTEANFTLDIIRLWCNFAKTGNPNNPESIPITWPPYDLSNQQYIALKPNMAIDTKLRAEYVAFWNYFIPDALRSMPKTVPENVPSDGKKIKADQLVIIIAFILSLSGVFI